MRRAAHIVWLLLAVLVRQSGLCALLPGTVLPQAALATPPAPLSGNRSDTVQHVELSFRFDRSLLDSAYRDNSSALHTLRNWLGPSCCASRIDSIGIFSYSSMEGYGWHNGQLARDRGRAVKGYLVWKYPHLNQYRIYIHPQGEDWAGLLRRLSDMPDLPSRDQIANLFDTGLSEEELKNRFRILIDSQSYRYLQSTLFPSLRRAIVRIYWRFRSGRPDRGNPIGRLLRRHRGRSRKRGHLHSGGKASVTRVRNPADDNPATGAPSCSGIAPGNGSPPGLSVPNRRPPLNGFCIVPFHTHSLRIPFTGRTKRPSPAAGFPARPLGNQNQPFILGGTRPQPRSRTRPGPPLVGRPRSVVRLVVERKSPPLLPAVRRRPRGAVPLRRARAFPRPLRRPVRQRGILRPRKPEDRLPGGFLVGGNHLRLPASGRPQFRGRIRRRRRHDRLQLQNLRTAGRPLCLPTDQTHPIYRADQSPYLTAVAFRRERGTVMNIRRPHILRAAAVTAAFSYITPAIFGAIIMDYATPPCAATPAARRSPTITGASRYASLSTGRAWAPNPKACG